MGGGNKHRWSFQKHWPVFVDWGEKRHLWENEEIGKRKEIKLRVYNFIAVGLQEAEPGL